MRVLVTGGAGFIGSHLVRRLLNDGHAVRVIDNLATGSEENLAGVVDDVEFIEGDIRSYERTARVMAGCEAVLHQAALPSIQRSIEDPLTSHDANVTASLNLFLSVRDAGVRRVVFALLASVYGANPALPQQEELVPLPISPYAVNKLACEHYARSCSEVQSLETVASRYFNVFGRGKIRCRTTRRRFRSSFSDWWRRCPHRFRRWRTDARLRLCRKCRGSQRAGANRSSGVRIGGQRGVWRLNLDKRVAGRAPGHHNSTIITLEYVAPRPGDVRSSLSDISLARQVLGYEPLIGLREGLTRTVEWYTDSLERRSAVGLIAN